MAPFAVRAREIRVARALECRSFVLARPPSRSSPSPTPSASSPRPPGLFWVCADVQGGMMRAGMLLDVFDVHPSTRCFLPASIIDETPDQVKVHYDVREHPLRTSLMR